MGSTALVTGSPARVDEVGDALESTGFTVSRASTDDALAAACEQLAPGSLDCYVQLPRETLVEGPTLVERVRQFLSTGLMARFEMAGRVLPLLAPESCVMLVAGHVPGGTTPDDRHARIDLLRVLARAVLAERPDEGIRAIVVGDHRSASDIAELTLRRGDEQRRRTAEVAALPSDLDYADWQREVLRLTTDEE